MPEAHSKWSASGFEAIMLCPGKKVLEAGRPDSVSKYAAEGTAAHQVLTWALQEDKPAAAYIGRVIEADGFEFDVDDTMAGHVQVCIDYVHDVAGDDGVILVDTQVTYAGYLNVPDADGWGTADVIVLKGEEIIVIDFKYGQGVEVHAGSDGGEVVHWDASGTRVRKPNPQMALYGLGALAGYGDLGDFRRVRLVISQPRLSVKPSEYDLSVEELEAWGRSTARSAVCSALNAALAPAEPKAWNDTYLHPGEKQCKFCRAKATCPALRDSVAASVFSNTSPPATADEFEEATPRDVKADTEARWLSVYLGKVDLIEDWCKAVRAEVERRLLAGEGVPGFKLVEGKLGNRAWGDAVAAEAMLKSFRLKQEQMYDFSLISPTTAEKLAPKFDKAGKVKPDQEPTPIGARQWPKLQALITRAPAKKHVAPADDPRPAITVQPVADEFDNVAPEGAEEFA